MVDAIINLAKAIGVKTLAEGVETKEELHYLQERGCDFYQGFITSRPMSKEDTLAWYDSLQKS